MTYQDCYNLGKLPFQISYYYVVLSNIQNIINHTKKFINKNTKKPLSIWFCNCYFNTSYSIPIMSPMVRETINNANELETIKATIY